MANSIEQSTNELAGYGLMPSAGDQRTLIDPEKDIFRQEVTLNMGPQHPSTHGVLRLLLDIEGEVVNRITVDPGYLHRGMEKLGESMFYNQFIPYTDRMDYVAAFTSEHAFCLAVEKLLGVEVPERAQYIRVILGELQRIASHLLWLGTHVMDIGAITVFLYAMRERESILDIMEMYCGARLTLNAMRVGGLPQDVPPAFKERVMDFLHMMPAHLVEYQSLLKENPIFLGRIKGIGVISAADAISYGLTGPSLRGSGVNYDVRKAHPYAVYDRMQFEVPLGNHGDVYDRYLVRIEEMNQSLKIIEQAVNQMPDGPIMTDDPHISLPSRDATMSSIEAMQRHFIITIKGFSAPAGEVYAAVESPKGELGYYLCSTGGSIPYRCRVRAPSYVNLGGISVMSEGAMIADLIAIIGSIDIVLGEVDR
jgi:NADH-quinone oxidoreductase subunit D